MTNFTKQINGNKTVMIAIYPHELRWSGLLQRSLIPAANTGLKFNPNNWQVGCQDTCHSVLQSVARLVSELCHKEYVGFMTN